MAKNTPAFQFYPADFLGGVSLLNEEQAGVYIKLLCGLWIHRNLLPFCFEKMARAANVPEAVMHRVWPAIEDKFVVVDGVVTHARFSKMIELSAIRAECGQTGKQMAKQTGGQKGKQNTKQTEEQKASKLLKNEERRMKNEEMKSEDWILPDGWDCPDVRQALEGWEAMRRRIGKPVRSRESTSKIFNNFDSPDHLAYAAAFCEANDYQGLKPDYRPTSARNGQPKTFRQIEAEQTLQNFERFLGDGATIEAKRIKVDG